MITNIINAFTQALSTPNVTTPSVTTPNGNNNPFANPFVTSSPKYNYYAKNNPVKGGYFAGYYNNKPNIVGKRLFLEV